MRKPLSVLLLILLIVVCVPPAVVAEQKKPSRFIVFIDPAHGGSDHGAQIGKLKEKEITLSLALAVRDELSKTQGIVVHLSRDTDKDISIRERLNLAGKVNPDIFLSLHINSGFSKTAGGYEVYFPGFGNGPVSKGEAETILSDMAKNLHLNESVRFARILHKRLDPVFPRKWRDLREAPLLLFSGIKYPAVKLEIGFSTNPEDHKRLMDRKSQLSTARAIAGAIKDLFLLRPKR